MSRLAVKEYCRQQLALLDVPVPCVVLAQRPREIAAAEQAVIIVTLPESREERFTAPRLFGRKQVTYGAGLEIYWVAADDQAGGTAFDQLLDQIDQYFRLAALPVAIRDPQSGEESQIVFIAEEIATAVEEPLLVEELQGYIVFTARKTVQVVEHTTG
ncbi:MAG: hypothetical protein M1118_10990 [Chloroflexi bacterium]|nr:hypothetical protein [Chloroflexota bacterium]